MSPSQLILISGFLGAGKTTILSRLLAAEGPNNIAVIINEAGLGLDHLLVEAQGDEVTLLQNGCMCCRSRGSLAPALAKLAKARAAEALPPFDRVFVETSGLADPLPILEEIASDPLCNRDFTFAGLVTVVDAQAFQSSLLQHPQVEQQVRLADRLLISKTDLIASQLTAQLQFTLREVNPEASQVIVPQQPFLGLDLWPEALGLVQSAKARTGLNRLDLSLLPVSSVSFEGEVDDEALDDWLQHTMMRFGPSLLRLKALINLKGSRVPLVVHGVQGFLHAPGSLRDWPGAPLNRAVLIGKDIDKLSLDDALLGLMSSATPCGVSNLRAEPGTSAVTTRGEGRGKNFQA